MKLNNKNIILTGAASGIGAALLNALPTSNRILAVDLKEIRTKHPAHITTYACDLSQPTNIDNLFNFAQKRFGNIDIFIANAGFAYYEKITSEDWHKMAKIFETNVFSAIYSLIKLNRINQNNPVHFVVTASAMGLLPLPGYALYGATKSAIHSFIEGYRFELPRSVKLSIVYPIATKTNFFQAASQKTPLPWPRQSAESVAKAIVLGIEKDKKRIFPSKTFWLMQKLPRHLLFFYQMWQQRIFHRWLDKQHKELQTQDLKQKNKDKNDNQ